MGGVANDDLDGGIGVDVLEGGLGNDTYTVDESGDIVIEWADEGIDKVKSSVTYVLAAYLEELFLSGSESINGRGNGLNNFILGNDGDNNLDGGDGSDTLVGGDGDDNYWVDHARDVVGENEGEGCDLINSSITLTLPANVEILLLSGTAALAGSGNDENNLLRGNGSDNVLEGGAGNDILEGESGADILRDLLGTALFNGGSGNDSLGGGASAEFYLAGSGNDSVSTGAGDDIIVFNVGDGQDSLSTGGEGHKSLSLGGDFAYSDLSMSKVSNDLVLKIGRLDQLIFEDWYAATSSRSVTNLQVIAEAMSGFNAFGIDPLLDQKVEHFDFFGLVGAFDAALAASPQLSNWSLMKALRDFRMEGSDSAAIGGDMAYQYGMYGTLVGIGMHAAQAAIGDIFFGAQAQTLRSRGSLQSEAVHLT